MILSKGQTIPLGGGRTATVLGKLGSGGYASVYSVRVNGADKALKVFRANRKQLQTSDFRRNLSELVRRGSPCAAYAWPEEMITMSDGTLAYLMPKVPDGFISLKKALMKEALPWSKKLRIVIHIVNTFFKLHAKGYAYCDISDANIYVHPASCAVCIIDCENITAYGNITGIVGTEGFTAPEILRGEKQPSIHTDHYALAALLFWIFCSDDPLHGAMYHNADSPEEVRALRANPVFMFDPQDKHNRPSPVENKAAMLCWPLLPNEVQQCFIRSITNTENRTSDREWLDVLMAWAMEGVSCPCGCFLSRSVIRTDENGAYCPFCGHKFRMPAALVAGSKPWVITLLPGRELYRCCVDWSAAPDPNDRIGVVVKSKEDARRMLLACLDPAGWSITVDGQQTRVTRKQAFPIRAGTKIRFSNGQNGTIIKESY